MTRLTVISIILYLPPKLVDIPLFLKCYIQSSKKGKCHAVAQRERDPLSVKSRIVLPALNAVQPDSTNFVKTSRQIRGTTLQAGRSLVLFPMGLVEGSNDIILKAAL